MLNTALGPLQLKGIVDSGSMVNIISQEMADASGLRTVELKEEAVDITGVNGAKSKCFTKIPMMAIYHSELELTTYGEFHVLKDADFDLLLGRLWGSINDGRIMDEPDGIYVLWLTGDQRWLWNVSVPGALPFKEKVKKPVKVRVFVDGYGSNEVVSSMVAIRAPKEKSKLSYVTDSEPKRLIEEYLKLESTSGEDARMGETAEWARGKVEEWKKGWEEEGHDKPGEDPELTPPPNQMGLEENRAVSELPQSPLRRSKRKRTVCEREGTIVVNQEVEEEFTRLVQEEVDEEEWGEFCAREKRRMNHRNQTWLEWIETDDEGNPPEDDRDPEIQDDGNFFQETKEWYAEPPNSPHEPSATLKTNPERTKHQESAVKKGKRPEHTSTETVLRRSRRQRTLTERGRYDTGGEGLWKRVFTCWVHFSLWQKVLPMLPPDTFHSHFKCNLNI